jgi:hypothetical protein
MTVEWQDLIFPGMVVLALVWSMSRRKKQTSSKLDSVFFLLSDINDNLRIIETRAADWQSKKTFKTKGWNFYREKVSFLEEENLETLSQSFTLASSFNERINIAKKNKNMATLQDMQLDQLRIGMTTCKDVLTKWLRANMEKERPQPVKKNFLGF